jgi:prepilin-type N-terminal cleavage/methylation domain-containing protein
MHVNHPSSPGTFRRLPGCRGFTLIEVMLSLVLMAMVGGIALRVLLRQHWTGLAQSETAALQNTLRAGAIFLATELRELGGAPGDADILLFAAESLTYRAMRGSGLGCSRGQNSLLIEAGSFSGYRGPQAGRDSLLLHLEGRLDTEADDRWLHLPISTIGSGACAGTPAILVSTQLDTTLVPAFASLAPVRTFEVMQVKLYQSGSDYWLGARSVSAGEVIQPLVGPLTSDGLALTYLDSLGGTASTAQQIRSVGVILRALSASAVRTGGFGPPQRRLDSLSTTVALRNW